MKQPEFWARLKDRARKLIPSHALRWCLLYVPAFTVGLLFALKVVGGLDDLVAYVMEVGTRSLPVLIGIALTYGVATGLQWNINNTARAHLQRIVAGLEEGSQWGAFTILAGEMLSLLALLVLILRALLVWQG